MENLKEIKEFRTSPELVEKLYEHSIKKEFKAGKIIVNEEAYVRAIPIITAGRLKVMRNDENGKGILLYYLQPGESCIMAFLSGLYREKSKVMTEVEKDAEILFLPIEKVTLFLKEYPEWVKYITRLYHRRFEELLETVNALAFHKVDERLLSLLQKKAEVSKSNTIQSTHGQLADELGTARVVVSRLLKKLEALGIVRLGRNKIELLANGEEDFRL